jgi:4-amino-4-deoxy-L-arabinose transferase-like glycosyltransferase
MYPHYPVADDAMEYDTYGWNMATERGFTDLDKAPVITRSPGYPFFLAVLYRIFGHSYVYVKFFQILISLFSLLFIFLLAKGVFGERVAFLSVSIGALYPPFISYNTFIYTETIFTFCVVSFIYFSWMAVVKMKNYFSFLAGLAIGYGALVRGEAILFLPASLLFGFIYLRKELKRIVLIILVALCVITPWTIRNYKVFNKFVPISSQGGSLLWISSYYDSGRKGEWMLWHFDDPYFVNLTKNLNSIERDQLLGKKGLENIKEHPFFYAKFCFKRFFMFWITGHSNTFIKLSDETFNYFRTKFYLKAVIKTVLLIFNTLLVSFGFFGIYKSLRKYPEKIKEIVLLSLPVAVILGIHVLLCAIPRYQVPVMPFMIIFASTVILSLRERYGPQ